MKLCREKRRFSGAQRTGGLFRLENRCYQNQAKEFHEFSKRCSIMGMVSIAGEPDVCPLVTAPTAGERLAREAGNLKAQQCHTQNGLSFRQFHRTPNNTRRVPRFGTLLLYI